MASEPEKNKSGGTESQGDSSLDADIHRIHSQIELLLEGLRIDGNSSASHSIVQAIQDGESLESVLSIAMELVTQDGKKKKNQKP
ncbi:uncharacterized protein BHQ10_004623 [Talaromyces amestolkiae]|uniref:Uncharacterized protein n=1 Tax=Talaromyces amestolkiae TaxID=1196081 RepID=A0A364KYP6_TALAM|nr:uncharacterized protein BHQ10_004623 [Talaromyces amestolkiae]RAO68611.1 hypothetical protein BHQ10_004623 [Talaromyces amestolkiae]